MSLRDFLTGAQAFEQGGQEFSQTASNIRQQAAQDQLSSQTADLYNKIRTGSDQEKAQAAATLNTLNTKAGVKDPYAEAISKNLFPSKEPVQLLTAQQLTSPAFGLAPDQAAAIAALPQKAQTEAVKAIQNKKLAEDKMTGASDRQKQRQEWQAGQKTINSAEQFGKTYASAQKGYDDAVGNIQASMDAFKQAPTAQSAFDLTTRIGRASGQVGAMSDNKQDALHFSDANAKINKLIAEYMNEPEKPLPPEIVKAVNNLADATIKATQEKRQGVLQNYAASMAAGSSDRLFQNGQKHNVIKNVEKNLGVSINKTDNGIELVKNPVDHTGPKADLLNEVNRIPDKATRDLWISTITNYGDIPKDKHDALLMKIKELEKGAAK